MLAIRWAYLLRRLALLLGVYFLLRLLFLILNHRILADVSFGRVLWAFVYGLRFDLSALAAINFPFIVLSFLPRAAAPKPAYERFLKVLFLALNVPFLIINVIDSEFFQFTGRRLTFQVLGLAGDAGVKWSSLLASYWPLVLVGLMLITLLGILYGKAPSPQPTDAPQPRPPSIWLWMLNLVLIFPLCI